MLERPGMLETLVRWSLENRIAVYAIALLLTAFGGWTAMRTPVDVLPDLTAPTVTVVVDAGGYTPTEVEQRITIPLVKDMPAVGKTPSMLEEDIRLQLSQYIEDPLVSVIVNEFAGTFSQQVRIVGATEKPASLPYRANMTVLDAMIAVGGLNEYAAGNRAKLIRFDKQTGRQREYDLRLTDLLRRGDSDANVMLNPGDVIIIPESVF